MRSIRFEAHSESHLTIVALAGAVGVASLPKSRLLTMVPLTPPASGSSRYRGGSARRDAAELLRGQFTADGDA